MKTDLALAVIGNRRWADIDCYALSLVQSGFKGKKVMFVTGCPEEVTANLTTLGFDVIPFEHKYPWLHFQTYRFYPALEYLRQHHQEHYLVGWFDVCDLVFQQDFTPWVEQNIGNHRLIAAKEGRIVKEAGINLVWIERIKNLTGQERQQLFDSEVLVSGSIVGYADAVLHLFEKMVEMIPQCDDMMGQDQGIYMAQCNRSPFKEWTLIPELDRGFISTVGMFLSKGDREEFWRVEPPYFDRDTGLVWTSDREKMFAIQHCYNRNYGKFDPDGSWRGIVERRYRNKA